jgi:hypothetical protein
MSVDFRIQAEKLLFSLVFVFCPVLVMEQKESVGVRSMQRNGATTCRKRLSASFAIPNETSSRLSSIEIFETSNSAYPCLSLKFSTADEPSIIATVKTLRVSRGTILEIDVDQQHPVAENWL